MFEYEYGEASKVARQSQSGCPRPGKSQHVFRGLARELDLRWKSKMKFMEFGKVPVIQRLSYMIPR